MTDPIARCTRIDLDDEGLPATLHLVLSEDVAARIARDFDVTTVIADPSGLRQTHLPFAEAADMARHFGRLPSDQAGSAGAAFYYCIDKIACRFWEDGLRDAPSADLIPNSAKADHLPCGHPIADSVFVFEDGYRSLATHPPLRNDMAHIDLPGTVWCVDGCGWFSVDDETYRRLRAVRA